jgi:sec-independent protein translocase protein TatA
MAPQGLISNFNILRSDEMFGLGTTEMIIILVLVLIIFGAGKLPEVAGSLGKGIQSFKDGAKASDDDQADT